MSGDKRFGRKTVAGRVCTRWGGFSAVRRHLTNAGVMIAIAGTGLGAAACGAGAGTPPSTTTAATSSASTSATSSAEAQKTVIVVGHSPDGTLSFFNDDGTVAGTHAFTSTTVPTAFSAAAGRLWYIGATDHHLHSLTPQGVDTDVAVLDDLNGGAFGLAVNADGTRWAWGVVLGSSAAHRARIDMGGVGVQTMFALEETTSSTVLDPRWRGRRKASSSSETPPASVVAAI